MRTFYNYWETVYISKQQCQFKLTVHGIHRFCSISWASVESCMFLSTSISVAHVMGFLPRPVNQFCNIFILMSAVLRRHSLSIASVIDPVASSSSCIPRNLYLTPIWSAMLMVPDVVLKLVISIRLGCC